MTTTAIYARYSSSKQGKSTTIMTQLQNCRRLVDGRPVEYVDRARTGRAVARRDELRRLLDDAEAGKIQRVIVFMYDRLGRNLAESASFVADLEDLDIEVVSATEGRDALSRGIHLVVAEHYSRALAERTREGLKQRFQQGAWTGGRPKYGYVVVDQDNMRVLVVNPEEAEVVLLVFDLYLNKNMSLKEIARELDRRGVPPRRSESWEHTSVRGVLTSELVTGKLVFNRRQCRLNRKVGLRRHRENEKGEHLVRQVESLRIIPDNVFESAQKRLASRGCNARGTKSPRSHRQMRAFTQLLHCEECGSVFYAQKSWKRKSNYVYYRCGKHQRKGAEACSNSRGVREDLMAEKVTDAFVDALEDESLVERLLRGAEKELQTGREEAARLKRAVGDVEGRIGRLTTTLSDPDTDPAARSALTRQIGKYEAEREKALIELDKLRKDAELNVEELVASVRDTLAEAKKSLAKASPQEFHDIIGGLIGPLVIGKDGAVRRTKHAPEAASGACMPYVVAGAGFEPAASGL